jgi:hypothetical protein
LKVTYLYLLAPRSRVVPAGRGVYLHPAVIGVRQYGNALVKKQA